MSEEFDELDKIAEATKYTTGRDDARGSKLGHGINNGRMERIQRSKGMFARVKKKPVTLPGLPPFKEE